MAYLYSIVYQPIGQEYQDHMGDYIRVPAQQVNLIPNHGIQGDQKAGHHPDRQLNLLSQEWLERAAALGYRSAPGQFGEQIIVSGLAMEELQPGTRLQLGGAVIEISKARTGCNRLEAAQGKSIAGLGALGVLARVITGGSISVGDPVSVVETASTQAAPANS